MDGVQTTVTLVRTGPSRHTPLTILPPIIPIVHTHQASYLAPRFTLVWELAACGVDLRYSAPASCSCLREAIYGTLVWHFLRWRTMSLHYRILVISMCQPKGTITFELSFFLSVVPLS